MTLWVRAIKRRSLRWAWLEGPFPGEVAGSMTGQEASLGNANPAIRNPLP